MGTQLDQEDLHLVIEATAVSSFPFRESVIIVVAFGNTRNGKVTEIINSVVCFLTLVYDVGTKNLVLQAGLMVYRHTGSKLQLVQVISTSEPSALQHFSFRSENYLLVTSDHGSSVIFWWAGEFLSANIQCAF